MIEKESKRNMKIAVVGAGVSGASVVRALLTHSNFTSKDQIDVFEPRETLAVGLPYNPSDDEAIRLNLAPDKLSVVQENPNDFVEWLEENFEDPTNFEDLVSRPTYGKYLIDRFTPYFEDEKVTHIQETIIDLEVLEQESGLCYRLKSNKGWSDTIYDAVFFAIGHPPYNDYYNLAGAENYTHNPYPMHEKLNAIDPSKKIGVVGSGATAMDLMRYLHLNFDLKHPLIFYDPNPPFNFVNIPYEGELPFTFNKKWIAKEKDKHDGFIPFERLLEVFKEDMAKGGLDNPAAVYEKYKESTFELKREAFETNDQKLALMQTYSSELVSLLPHLFNALSGEDKVYYLENYHSKLLFIKSRVPNLTFKWLFELYDAGKLRVVGGLEDIILKDDGHFIVKAAETEEIDFLINATGFNMNIEKVAERSELIQNLFDKEIILPHRNGNFILVDWPETRVMNQRYGLMENLIFLGLLIGGTQHENNDASLTIEQGTYSATAFMDNLNT